MGLFYFMNRDFKGVWIPKDVWLDHNLTWMEKLLLVEIDSLDAEKGCFASNGYFGEFFNLSNSRISEMITSLVSKGYITTFFFVRRKASKTKDFNTYYTYSENRWGYSEYRRGVFGKGEGY